MKWFISLAIFSMFAITNLSAKTKTVKIRIIETTDVHGSFLPYDFIKRQQKKGSMARIYSYIENVRKESGKNLLLLDNGDILQGQPITYFFNYIAKNQENIAASITNFMGYNVQNIGNHDIEPGHEVYDKWIGETRAAVLGANIIDKTTGKPYLKPYEVFYRDGVKIVVLGMLTPAIPSWLGEELWENLQFEEMMVSTRKWVEQIRKQEKPDILIGLFHSGRRDGISTSEYKENCTEEIAREIPGFDIIFYGHDHIKFCSELTNREGKNVWILNPANNARNIAYAEITVTLKKNKIIDKHIEGKIVNIEDEPISDAFIRAFAKQADMVSEYVNRPIGRLTEPMSTNECYFGSCPFTDFVQNMQLKLSGAQVSFFAPLTLNTHLDAGELHVGDMFNLYKFENKLCTVKMTGEEIRRHLEMSYSLWINTMESKEDHILLLNENTKDNNERAGFKNYIFNFDSAAGIDYEVDVTKPDGHKVKIIQFSNGEPFNPRQTYLVAMNSYRANGGGELLTRGAGLSKSEIEKRKVWESELDLRYYLMQEIENVGTITPKANNNWRFVPEEWTMPAIERDKKILFQNNSK